MTKETLEEKYKAILISAGYPLNNVEELSVEDCKWIGQTTQDLTKKIYIERNKYKDLYAHYKEMYEVCLDVMAGGDE